MIMPPYQWHLAHVTDTFRHVHCIQGQGTERPLSSDADHVLFTRKPQVVTIPIRIAFPFRGLIGKKIKIKGSLFFGLIPPVPKGNTGLSKPGVGPGDTASVNPCPCVKLYHTVGGEEKHRIIPLPQSL